MDEDVKIEGAAGRAAVLRAVMMAVPHRMAAEAVECGELDGHDTLAEAYGDDLEHLPLDRLLVRLEDAALEVAGECDQPSPLDRVWIEGTTHDVVMVTRRNPLTPGVHRGEAWTVYVPLADTPATEDGLRRWAGEVMEAVREATALAVQQDAMAAMRRPDLAAAREAVAA